MPNRYPQCMQPSETQSSTGSFQAHIPSISEPRNTACVISNSCPTIPSCAFPKLCYQWVSVIKDTSFPAAQSNLTPRGIRKRTNKAQC